MEIEVEVEGLARVLTALSRLRRESPDLAQKSTVESGSIIARVAKSRVPHGPGAGGHASSSIRSYRFGEGSKVEGGGAAFPYYPWLDFGGAVGKNNSVRRPFIRRGRYIWAALGDNQVQIKTVMDTNLRRGVTRSGLDVD